MVTAGLWLPAFTFAVYTILGTPQAARCISPVSFYWLYYYRHLTIDSWFIYGQTSTPSVQWNSKLLLVILYLGAGDFWSLLFVLEPGLIGARLALPVQPCSAT